MQKKMGRKAKNLLGRRFGKLRVVSYVGNDDRGRPVWRCRCDCGNEVDVARPNLTSREGRRSCGCLSSGRSALDLEGMRFGMLTAIERLDERIAGAVVWRCRCDCGNEVAVKSHVLASGKKENCGCKPARRPYRDLAGMRFGMLTAIEPCGKAADNSYLWRCRCDCGCEKAVKSSHLTSGKTRSCGCASRRRGPAAERRRS